jgi:ribosomal protein L35
LTTGGSKFTPSALTGRLITPPSLLLPFAARTLATKQSKAGGAKMKSLSCWKRRFKVGANGLVRMRAGHRHKRAVKPPHVRRRLRSRTTVHDALAKKMVVRGFTRERLC